MSQTTVAAGPGWDVADRMRKALRESGIGVQEIADFLGVSRGAVSTWINGRIEPSTQTLRLWAQHCQVSYEWLASGDCPKGGDCDWTLASEAGGEVTHTCSKCGATWTRPKQK